MKQFKFLEETYSGNHSAPKNLLCGMNLIDAFNPPFCFKNGPFKKINKKLIKK